MHEFLLVTFFVRNRISEPDRDFADIYEGGVSVCTGFIWLRSKNNGKQNANAEGNELLDFIQCRSAE